MKKIGFYKHHAFAFPFFLIGFPVFCYIYAGSGDFSLLQEANSLFDFYQSRYKSALKVSITTASYYEFSFFLFHFVGPVYFLCVLFYSEVEDRIKNDNKKIMLSIAGLVLSYFPIFEWDREETIIKNSLRGTLMVGYLYPIIVAFYTYVTANFLAQLVLYIKRKNEQ